MFDPDGNSVDEGVVVNYEDRDGEWTYSPKRYWIPSAKYAFLGLYPADADVTVPDLKVDNDGSSVTVLRLVLHIPIKILNMT